MRADRDAIDVLLIEDDQVDVLHFQRVTARVETLGFRSTSDVAEALGIIGSELDRRWLVILDLNLPGLDGHDFLRRLRDLELQRPVPVVVLTTSDDERDITAAWQAGVAGYLVKPVSPELYAQHIHALLQWWSVNRW